MNFVTKLAKKVGVYDKKGLASLVRYGTLFVVVAIVLAVGAKVLDKFDDNLTGTALDAAKNGTEGIAELASWLPTIALVIAAAIIIGLVIFAFARYRGGQ